MAEHGVHLDGAILEVPMVNATKDCPRTYTLVQVADANLQTLRRLLQHLQLGPNLQILLRGSSQTAAVSSGSAVGQHP